MKKEQLASNFELNVLKIGVNRFQLVKGDRFISNGRFFNYAPSTAENKTKLPFREYHRDTAISCKKYQNDVLKADNIKLVVDSGDWKEWEVQYAYNIPAEEKEPLIIMVISNRWDKGDWKFSVDEYVVDRETPKCFFLKKHNPVTYKSKIDKSELNNVYCDRGEYSIMCKIEDYNEMEILLYKRVEEFQLLKIETAKNAVIRETAELLAFNELKIKNGF